MVRQWQKCSTNNRLSGIDLDGNPDFVKLAEAYGAKGLHLRRAADVDRVIQAAMEYNDGPCLNRRRGGQGRQRVPHGAGRCQPARDGSSIRHAWNPTMGRAVMTACLRIDPEREENMSAALAIPAAIPEHDPLHTISCWCATSLACWARLGVRRVGYTSKGVSAPIPPTPDFRA